MSPPPSGSSGSFEIMPYDPSLEDKLRLHTPKNATAQENTLTCQEFHVQEDQPNALCSECLSVDFQAWSVKEFGSLLFSRNLDFVLNIRHSLSQLLESSCPLCQLLGTIASSSASPTDEYIENLQLLAIRADWLFARLDLRPFFATIAFILLSDDTSSALYLPDSQCALGLIDLRQPAHSSLSTFGVRKLNQKKFDVEVTGHWIDTCRLNHTVHCNPTELVGIPSFRVIDCLTQTVIQAPHGCQYVALSYVWGESHYADEGTEPGGPRLQTAPKVITDSVKVVKLLGFRYLWVDRYCIDQSDVDDKHHQICRMDVIYASAQLTIIAATSDDPDDGLAGVGDTPRNSQPACQVGDHELVSPLITASSSLASTAWMSRGWTYQEGLLSKRRLIFTKDQVYFECNGMHCAEVVHLPLQAMHDTTTGKFKAKVPPGAFAQKSIGDNPWSVMRYVSEFTKRKLSHQSDALNAIQGIFRAFEKGQYPLYQLMGVPIMPSHAIPIPRSPEDGFMMGLLWNYKYPNSEGCHRRQEFPSWSWARWSAQTEDSLVFKASANISRFQVQISAETSDGDLVSFPQEHSSIPAFVSRVQNAKYIHVTARTATCEIVRRSSYLGEYSVARDSSYGALVTSGIWSICLEFVPSDDNLGVGNSSNGPLQGKRFTAIIFAPDTNPENLDWQVSAIIVAEKGGYAERMGICLEAKKADLRGVAKARMVSNFGDRQQFGWPRHSTTDKLQNKQAFKEWYGELPIRTIRWG